MFGTPNSVIRMGTSTFYFDENGRLVRRVDTGSHDFGRGIGEVSPHTHRFDWRLQDGIWRWTETILPFV